jgi:hypothetical protein
MQGKGEVEKLAMVNPEKSKILIRLVLFHVK